MNAISVPYRIGRPAAPLRHYISHYWLSLNNTDTTYAILPDGTVDMVATLGNSAHRVDVFGTTTLRTELTLEVGGHYLGIRFKPGQSRHFVAARGTDITDRFQPAADLTSIDILGAAEFATIEGMFAYLDSELMTHLKRHPPRYAKIDQAIQYIESTQGTAKIAEVADLYGKSRRQFERNFLAAVGVPAKLFAEIMRFQHASLLLSHTTMPLAQLAAELGYTDQSHMTHEFVRFYGQPPARTREHDAFLQDAYRLPPHN